MPEALAWKQRVENQLARVILSEEFKKSKRLQKFLSYVVNETLVSGATVIRSYNIAVEVFGKGEGFDPGDPYVRNIARHVRRSLNSYYESDGLQDDIIIDVPAGNYIATFKHRNTMADPKPPENKQLNHQCFVDVGAANEEAGFVDSTRLRKAGSTFIPTIAIIPFTYHGSAQEDEAVIGDILAGSVIGGLAKSTYFNVISKLSTSKFRGASWTLEQIADSLNSDYVMSGRYLCSNGNLILLVELADCKNSEVVWADELRCTVGELLREEDSLVDNLIDQAARSIISHEVSRAAFGPLDSLAMHTRLVAGVHDMHLDSNQRFVGARKYLEQIVRRHPFHTAVNAQLAHWYVLMLNRIGSWNHVTEEHETAAYKYLKRALHADPGNALALTINGLVETQFHQNPEKGLEYYNLAEKNNPNEALLFCYKAAVLSYKGEGIEAVEYAKKALKLSPFDPQLHMFHTCAAAAYYSVSDYENAENHAKFADKLNPRHSSNLRTLVAIQMDLGKTIEAKQSARRLLEYDPKFTVTSYLSRSPNASYRTGKLIADRLARAGVPSK